MPLNKLLITRAVTIWKANQATAEGLKLKRAPREHTGNRLVTVDLVNITHVYSNIFILIISFKGTNNKKQTNINYFEIFVS